MQEMKKVTSFLHRNQIVVGFHVAAALLLYNPNFFKYTPVLSLNSGI